MLRIPDAVEYIVKANPFFQFGISHRLINLSQLAKFIKPLVETRTKKMVKSSAITMALSRLQKGMTRLAPNPQTYKLENINVHSHLTSLTYLKNDETHKQISKFYAQIQKKNGFATLTEGVSEITIIFDDLFEEQAHKIISNKPKNINKDITVVGMKFDADYVYVPGFLYAILQQTTLQHINIVELASTFTEFMLYVENKDAKLTFDTLYNCFMQNHT